MKYINHHNKKLHAKELAYGSTGNSNTPVILEETEEISAGADERSELLFLAAKEPTAHLLQEHQN